MQYLRILRIDELISGGKYPDVKKLSHEVECGTRQIHRDLKDIKEFGDRIPTYSKIHKGYYYPEPPTEPLVSVLGLSPQLSKAATIQKSIDQHDLVSVRVGGGGQILQVAPIAICAPGKSTLLVAAELPTNRLQILPLSKVQILEVKPHGGELPLSVHGRLMSDYVQWVSSGQAEMSFSE